MTQTFKGWTVGLEDKDHAYFLGVHTTAEGTKYGNVHKTPLEKGVYDQLFSTPEDAMFFWKTCYWEYLAGKKSFKAVPVKIDISVGVSALGFQWNGI